MGKFEFTTNSHPTIGVELELGIVNADSGELTSSITQVLDALPKDVLESAKPELMQCCVEINTGICQTVSDVKQDLTYKLKHLETVTDQLGLGLWWGATHPFSRWKNQHVSPNERYQNLVNLLQEMAKRLITFGLHIHIGVDSGDKSVMICDRIMQHLPTLLALCCSSPYWESRDTGLYSYRSKIMEGLPTAGLPSLMRNWSEYVWLINHLVDTGFINTMREIWWDVRPHHRFGTVEVRICDMPGSLDDALAITALVQSLVKTLSDQIDEGMYQHDCHPMIVRQNKWRACRFGNEAQLVNSYTYEVQPVTQVANDLVARLRGTAQQLKCEVELEEIIEIAKRPSWSARQREILDRTDSQVAVVKELVQVSRLS